MKDIRLKAETMELDGKTFKLRCNFNVLADAQEHFGDFKHLTKNVATFKNARFYLASMMNDYADEQGWAERYTPEQVGRMLPTDWENLNTEIIRIMKLVMSAVMGEASEGNP